MAFPMIGRFVAGFFAPKTIKVLGPRALTTSFAKEGFGGARNLRSLQPTNNQFGNRRDTKQRLKSNANTPEGMLERLQWNAPDEVNRAVAEKTWYYVSSSNIDAIKYDIDTQVLSVKFLSGATYQYMGVPYDLALKFMMATESHGKFFWRNIRDQYPFVKV